MVQEAGDLTTVEEPAAAQGAADLGKVEERATRREATDLAANFFSETCDA